MNLPSAANEIHKSTVLSGILNAYMVHGYKILFDIRSQSEITVLYY